MLQATEYRDASKLVDRLRNAPEADAALMAEIIDTVYRRFPSAGQSEKTARIEQLIRSGAWTDAALSLIDLELPLWHLRRIAYARASGTALCRANANCRTGSIVRSKAVIRIWRLPSWALSSRLSAPARPRAEPASRPSRAASTRCTNPSVATISARRSQKSTCRGIGGGRHDSVALKEGARRRCFRRSPAAR